MRAQKAYGSDRERRQIVIRHVAVVFGFLLRAEGEGLARELVQASRLLSKRHSRIGLVVLNVPPPLGLYDRVSCVILFGLTDRLLQEADRVHILDLAAGVEWLAWPAY